jgi:hypothetical protein
MCSAFAPGPPGQPGPAGVGPVGPPGPQGNMTRTNRKMTGPALIHGLHSLLFVNF